MAVSRQSPFVHVCSHLWCGCEEYWHGRVVPPRERRTEEPVTVEQTAVPPVVSVTARQEKTPTAQPRRKHRPYNNFKIRYVGGSVPLRPPLLRVLKEWHGRVVPPRVRRTVVPGTAEQTAGPPVGSVTARQENCVARRR